LVRKFFCFDRKEKTVKKKIPRRNQETKSDCCPGKVGEKGSKRKIEAGAQLVGEEGHQ